MGIIYDGNVEEKKLYTAYGLTVYGKINRYVWTIHDGKEDECIITLRITDSNGNNIKEGIKHTSFFSGTIQGIHRTEGKLMCRWSEIMEENKEQLIEALEKTFKDAVDYRHMQYITEIYQDGTIRIWSCSAGSNSFSHDSFVGKSHEVKRFCFSNMDIEVTEEDFRRHMIAEEQHDTEWRSKEVCLSFLNYIYSSGNYTELIEKVEQEWLDWYKDEYAYTAACEAVEYKIIQESELEER